MKSLFERIGMSFSRCGICLRGDFPCEKCIKSSLKSNGLPLKYAKQLKGISDRDDAHAFAEYSPFKMAIKKIIDEHYKNRRLYEH